MVLYFIRECERNLMGSELTPYGSDPQPPVARSFKERREQNAIDRQSRLNETRALRAKQTDHLLRLEEQRNKGKRIIHGAGVIRTTVEAVDGIIDEDPYIAELVRPMLEKGARDIADQV